MKKQSYPNLIISLSSGLVRPYLTYMTAGESTYFVYPAQTRGIAIGNALMGAYLKRHFIRNHDNQGSEKSPSVMICGKGATIHYLIETFIMQYESILRLKYSDDTQVTQEIVNRLGTDFLIVSDSKYYRDEAVVIRKEDVKLKNRTDYSYPLNHYHAHIKKSLKNTEKFGPDNIILRNIECNPSEISNIDLIWQENCGFDIIVITDERIDNEMIMLSSFLAVINKYKTSLMPSILISSESGQLHRLRNIADANLFYYVMPGLVEQTMPSLPGSRVNIRDVHKYYYPSQYGLFSKFRYMAFGDSIIDVLDDAKEQVSGILFSFKQEKESRGQTPAIKLHLCIQNHPGSLALACAQLSNFKFEPFYKTSVGQPPVNIPSFSFCRFIAQNKYNFCLSTYSSLRPALTEYDYKQGVLRAYVSTRRKKNDDPETYGIIEDLMKNRLLLNNNNISGEFKDCDQCPHMKACPISGYRRHMLVRLNQKLPLGPHYYFSTPPSDTDFSSGIKDPTFAKVTACCRDANNYGSLTFLLNTLCLNKLQGAMRDYSKGIDVFYITYGRDFDCFEDSRSLSRVYGNLIHKSAQQFEERIALLYPHDRDKWKSCKDPFKLNPIIKGLLIRPCPQGFSHWYDYATKFTKLLNECYGENGDYYPGHKKGEKPPKTEWRIYPDTRDKCEAHGVILMMDSELYKKKQREMDWRRELKKESLSIDEIKTINDKYNEPPKFHMCFCGEMKGKRPKDKHQPYEDCPFNKDLNTLFGLEALE